MKKNERGLGSSCVIDPYLLCFFRSSSTIAPFRRLLLFRSEILSGTGIQSVIKFD